MARIFDSTEKMAIADHGFNPTLTEYDPRIQSFSWRLHALIVQDPFIPTYVSFMLFYVDFLNMKDCTPIRIMPNLSPEKLCRFLLAMLKLHLVSSLTVGLI